jgi:hypothetical protein
MELEFAIVIGDISEFSADVVVLKHAQAFYGADKFVSSKLEEVGISKSSLSPRPDDYTYLDTRGGLVAPKVLFVGVPPLFNFGYPQIRDFASDSLTILSQKAPETRHLATTVHGVGFGLDEVEAFLAQLGGYLQVLQEGRGPQELQRISIVDRNYERVKRLRSILDQNLARANYATKMASGSGYRLSLGPQHMGDLAAGKDIIPIVNNAITSAGSKTEIKPKVFVAMPFDKNFTDVFDFGISTPAREEGFICERIDQEVFIGDILEKIKEKIETSKVVIAELSGSNPNVYLELGYAWGKGRPTILLAKKEEKLLFDVRGQRCLKYELIGELKDLLQKELKQLKEQNII